MGSIGLVPFTDLRAASLLPALTDIDHTLYQFILSKFIMNRYDVLKGLILLSKF